MHISTQFHSMVIQKHSKHKKIKYICWQKWKQDMFEHLVKLKRQLIYSQELLDDFKVIIGNLRQEYFINTIMEIESLGHYLHTILKNTNTNTTINNDQSQILTHLSFEKLSKMFNQNTHPFKWILQGFIYLQKKKYQKLSAEKNTDEIILLLTIDRHFLIKFLQLSSSIYLSIPHGNITKTALQKHINKIINVHIQTHQPINTLTLTIIRNQTKLTYSKISKHVSIQQFSIPNQFKIEGLYMKAINQLIIFCKSNNPPQSLNRLAKFRYAIIEDIDRYYQDNHLQQQYGQITADIQIQIIRFIICKLKDWLIDIKAQLKFLEIVYGQKQIGRKFQQASYMHSQISVAIETLLQSKE